MSFRDEEIAAELAESMGGVHEWFSADAYSFRRLGKLDNSDVRRLSKVLSATAWAKANPARRREIARKWWHSEKGRRAKAKRNAKLRAERAEAAKKWAALICEECRKPFKRRRRGPTPRFCSNPCWSRARYQRLTPGARRIRRHRLNPLTVEQRAEARRAYQREWARKRKASA